AIEYHYPKMLEDMGKTQNEIRKAFKMPLIEEENVVTSNTLKIQHERTIESIEKETWDKLLGGRGIFDHDGMKLIEKSFSKNEKPEDNWDFHYIMISDSKGIPVLAT